MEEKVVACEELEAYRRFLAARKDPKRVRIRWKHISTDHPERKWTRLEILNLVCSADCRVSEFVKNEQPSAWEHSWIWKTPDEDGRPCQFPLQLREDDGGNIILVITAIR